MSKIIKFPNQQRSIHSIFPLSLQYAIDELLANTRDYYSKKFYWKGFLFGWLVCSFLNLVINVFI